LGGGSWRRKGGGKARDRRKKSWVGHAGLKDKFFNDHQGACLPRKLHVEQLSRHKKKGRGSVTGKGSRTLKTSEEQQEKGGWLYYRLVT